MQQRSLLVAKQCPRIARTACDVFLNHRKIDTARTIVGLLYENLKMMRVRAFLDTMNMKPGDRLLDHIDKAIGECKVGVAVFSPAYCDSFFCLHELALLVESKKRVVPVFYDIKPSQLRVKPTRRFTLQELRRFSLALEEAKCIRGISFDSLNGDWSKLVRNASDAVLMNLFEVERESASMSV
ncbi:TIR-only protein-like [Prosopis cineraria]|uniref:TIR-only protein-like n=1 Tax=Prosopis cineraria TaxID=364024 RepID=UPI0024101E68|nr:TIR-only protein-like [Prosopis cineraria]XP_054801415.1 TIR-only protein-like [Prosopis cineraria]